MPRAHRQSGKNTKKAYQGKQEEEKVCPERVGKAGKSRKGHTRESKQGAKYAPSASAKRKYHEKGILKKARREKSMPQARRRSERNVKEVRKSKKKAKW